MRSAGNTMESRGKARRAAAEAVHTIWRAAAERRRSRVERIHATPSTRVLLSAALARIGHAETVQLPILFALVFGCFNHFRHTVELFAGKAGGGNIEQCRDNLFGAPIKEGLHDMLHGASLGLVPAHHREVDILESFGFVLHMALLLEYAE